MTESSAKLTPEEVEGRILDFIRQELLGSGATVEREDDLLSGELLDSMGILRLTTFVEQEYRIRIPPASFVVENFQNVEVLAGFVCRTANES